MSVAGLDFGNLNFLIAQTSKGGVDVILNGASNRQNASYLSIQGKQRFLGDAAANMARSNILNTVAGMKLLVGRQFDSPEVQRELSKQAYKGVRMPNGGVGVELNYNDAPVQIPIEHALAMVLAFAKLTSKQANNGVDMADVVVAVPYWFTDAQRRGVLTACEIAGMHCLKVANESTNIALSYGIFKSAKKLFSETEPTHMMFIDLGYTCYTVSIVDFIQENMRVLSTVCDPLLGGRDFDDAIIEFLAETFEKKTGINVRGNPKTILKLQAGAEKAKKTLSPNGVTEASLSIECVANDVDLNVTLTKDEFESRIAGLIEKLEGPIVQALSEAGLTKDQLAEIEIVGGSSRVNIVKRRLGEILGLDPTALNYGLKTTMNADEAVCRGGALQCAMLSSRVKVKPFNIVDKVPYGIKVNYEVTAPPSEEEGKEDVAMTETSAALYNRGDDLPHKPRRLTFRKSSDFVITVSYDEASAAFLPQGEPTLIATYTIKVPPQTQPKDVRVTFNLDKNGCIYIQSAQMVEEIMVEEPAPVPEPAPAAPESAGEGKEGETKEGETPAADSKEQEVPATVMKRKLIKTDLQFVVDAFELSRDEVRASIDLEASMAYQDRLIVETADKRNEVESYIYAMRDKLEGTLKEFVTAADKDTFSALLTTIENWLYDEGYDTTKQEYTSKIDELKALGDPIEYRYNEDLHRAAYIQNLTSQIDHCKSFCSSRDEKYEHITDEERSTVRKALEAAQSWLYDTQSKQADLPKSTAPILTLSIIEAQRKTLYNTANPIMLKPKPKVEAPPPPAPEEKAAAEDKSQDQSSGASEEEGKTTDDSKPSEEKGNESDEGADGIMHDAMDV